MNKLPKLIVLSIIVLPLLLGLTGEIVLAQAANTPVFLGLSGYPTSTMQVQSIIDTMTANGLNVYRICFNPEWFSNKPHPYNPAYIQYFLDYSSYTIIVDRNHLYPPTETSSSTARRNWKTVENSIFQVLQTWPNNPRVAVDLISEYVSNDFYSRMQSLVTQIRVEGYTNPIVINKWSQPWTIINDALDNTYQGYHYYFNSWSVSGAISNVQNALSKGIKLINTEVGADYREYNYFTKDTVGELNSFMTQCVNLGVGNAVWMNENLNNLPRYQELGLQFPIVSPVPNGDTTPPTISEFTPTNGAFVNTPTATIAATVTDTSGIEADFIVMTLDGVLVPSTYDDDTGLVSYAASTLAEGPHSVTLEVSDTVANLARAVWEFIVDTTPPAQVTKVTVTSVSYSQLDVSWATNTDAELDHYNVYRSTTSEGPYTWVASPTQNSYSDNELTASTTYYYTVTAVDTAKNEGPYAAEASGTTSEAPAQPTMHVTSIVLSTSSRSAGRNKFVWATASVTIVDGGDNQVGGVTVYGHWEGATSDSDSGTTDSSGQVTVSSASVKNPLSDITFTFVVDNVVLDGWIYNPSTNVETSDSITV